MRQVLTLLLLATTFTACGGRPKRAAPAPVATVASAPALTSVTVMVFPVQQGRVPSPDANAQHWPADRAALDAEIAYWLQQAGTKAKWILPAAIDRALARSPGLGIDPRSLAVGSFQVAQVKRIGDPLFGDLRRLAAVFDGHLALLPVAAEYIGTDAANARLHIAAAVVNALDGTVLWFGVIPGSDAGVATEASIASAAQAFARAFSGQPLNQ